MLAIINVLSSFCVYSPAYSRIKNKPLFSCRFSSVNSILESYDCNSVDRKGVEVDNLITKNAIDGEEIKIYTQLINIKENVWRKNRVPCGRVIIN